MSLTEEAYENIEQLAACNYSPEKIALYLGVKKIDFMRKWYDHTSKVRYHYDKGQLSADFEISQKRLENAKAGNLTADMQHQKETEKRRTEDVKMKLLFCGNTE